MNKNKLIFAIIGILLLLLVIFTVSTLSNTSNEKQETTTASEFVVWLVGNTNDSFSIIENFKKVNPDFSSRNIRIETFTNYEDYYYALMSAITLDSAPDIFVLNNNEKRSIFSNQTVGINPTYINTNDFRKKYKGVFADDLIVSTIIEDETLEYLSGLPVGYESLGIFYNRRYVKNSDLTSISALNNVIANLKEKYPHLIPIGIGNGTTVSGAGDIITQFFMLEDDIYGLADVNGAKAKQALASYFLYADTNGYNGFESRFLELSNMGQNSIDLFSKGETFMVVGYPSLINEIENKGFSKNFLLATPFPHYHSGNGSTLINYDYLAINKDSEDIDMANKFLVYLSSDIGAENYLNTFKYQLPALLSLESDKLSDKIHDKYNIVLEDFYNNEYPLSSFDKGIKNIYDKGIRYILDNSSNYESSFNKFRDTVLCKTEKITTLENLSSNCEK